MSADHDKAKQSADLIKVDPPSRSLLPFDVSNVDLANLGALGAEALRDAVRSVMRTSPESMAKSSFSNTSPGTDSWSSFNSHNNSS
jgi:hypothetical protein